MAEDKLVGWGWLTQMPDGAALGFDLVGQVSVGRAEGVTRVVLEVWSGVGDGETFPAHVHNKVCAEGGGGHYLIDPGAAPGASNEVWPTLNTSAGYGYGEVYVDHDLRADALSVVIHDPVTRAKIACSDLNLSEPAYDPSYDLRTGSGSFGTLADGAALGFDIQGSITVYVGGGSTTVIADISSGLGDGETYPSHVHTGACADGAAGHYLIDANAGPSAGNEIWPTVTSAGGTGHGEATVNHEIRDDARSVVIHDPGTRAKIACADIVF